MDRLSNLDVLKGFTQFWDDNQMSPTVRELGAYLGVSGPSAQRHVNALVASGYLTRRAGQSRTLAITPEGKKALG